MCSLSIRSIRPKTVTALCEVSGDRSGWKGDMPMPARYEGPYFFTAQLLQNHNRTIIRLRNLDRDACLELRKIGRSNLTNKRYLDAGVFLSEVAAHMTSALQFLVE